MRERTELRRYEKELLVRAQEVQLEDRHDRLQQELRERLANDGKYFYFLVYHNNVHFLITKQVIVTSQ